MNYPIILSQTKFVHKDTLQFPFEERGLQFGDGVYEVIRVYKGNCYLLEEHVNRLFRSASAIEITLPFTKAEITERLLTLLEKNEVQTDSKIYLQATRGSAPREHTFPDEIKSNVYAYVSDQPRKLDLITNGAGAITKRDERWENCYIKSLNLLPNVLAKQEAKENDCYEAILHKNGLVTECSSSNVFFVKDGKIKTHPATKAILHGCVRNQVEQFAKKLGIPLEETAFTFDEIREADELFLSSSISEVMPIVTVDNQEVADGKPGPITRALQTEYEKDANLIGREKLPS